MEQTLRFEEGQPCPIKIQGTGGGISFSPNGDMLLIGRFPSPSEAQIKAWEGKWQARLVTESDFPSIPIFAIGSEDWIIETPCNPAQQEEETPGFCEALYSKDDFEMVAVLVCSETGIIMKIAHVPLDEMFIERMIMSWNPFRKGDQYNQVLTEKRFVEKINEIFKMRSSKQLWTSSQ